MNKLNRIYNEDCLEGSKGVCIKMTDLITEARKLCEGAKALVNEPHTERLDYNTEYLPLIDAIQTIPKLCDALEQANARIESIHESLDFAETQRQKSKNYTELAINNGLALGRIAVTIQHDFGPLPAAPEEGAEHERD